MEEENQTSSEANNSVNNVTPVNPTPPVEPTVSNLAGDKHRSNKWVFPVLAVALLCAIGGGAWFLFKGDKSTENNSTQSAPVINSYEECVNADYPVMESSPEKCSVPGGQTFVNTNAEDNASEAEESDVATLECSGTETLFADEEFGARFCYPVEWGTASVMDAKVGTDDTGHREAVRFSANTKFIVGGTSEDWSTTIGRGVGCQEPNNVVPELSSYDTNWHDFSGEGMDVEFATRSIVTTEGGYDITETVSNMLDVGVCVQGHKVINGSRYRVLSEAFFTDFSEAAGITTPRAHIDNSSILYTDTERAQFDALLASAVTY